MGLNSPIPVSLPSECRKASRILRSFINPQTNNGLDKVIPRQILQSAAGFAIFTVIKAGFLFSARGGSGLVIARLEDGSWSAPSAIGLGGFGFGGQLGAEVTDFLVVLNTRTAVRTFMAAGSMTLGGNLSVAVGPLGRNAEGSGTVSAKGKTAALYSYSKTKGLFGGISVEGSIIVERQDANRLAYGYDVSSKQLLSGGVNPPDWAELLIDALKMSTGMPGGREWVQDGGGYGEDDGEDPYDEYGMPKDRDAFEAGLGGGSGAGGGRKRAGTLPRSNSHTGHQSQYQSQPGNYAFGSEGVSSFSSSPPPTNNTTNRARSGSGSLRGIFTRAESIPGVAPGVGFPRRGKGGSTPPRLESPRGDNVRQGSSLNPFSSRGSGRGGNDDPFDEAAGSTSHAREINPFDTYDSSATSSSSKRYSGLTPDMDLSQEIISPWNNEKGLPSPKPKYDARTGSNPPLPEDVVFKGGNGGRSRSSTLNSISEGGYEAGAGYGGGGGSGKNSPNRSRAGSNVVGGGGGGVIGAKMQSPLREDYTAGRFGGDGDGSRDRDRDGKDLLGQWGTDDTGDVTAKFGRLRASTIGDVGGSGSGSPGKLMKRDNSGYNDFGDDGEDIYNSQGQYGSYGNNKKKEEWTVNVPSLKGSGGGGGLFGGKNRKRAGTAGSDFIMDPNEWHNKHDVDERLTPGGHQAKADVDDFFNNGGQETFGATFGESGAGAGIGSGGGASRPRLDTRPTFTIRKELAEAEKDGLPRAIALYDFEAAEGGDLGFKKSDVLIVVKHGKSKEDWWTGRNPTTGKEGIFPANFVELVKPRSG